MVRIILGCDVDGVIANIEPGIAKRISAHFGVPINEVKKDKFLMHERFDIGFEEMELFLGSELCLGGNEVWLEASAFRDNICALNDAFFAGHDVVYITGRHSTARTASVEWLLENKVQHNYLLMNTLGRKHKAMKMAGAELMIEDRYHEAKTIAEQGYRSYILETPYTLPHKLGYSHPNLIWVPDVRTALEHVGAI